MVCDISVDEIFAPLLSIFRNLIYPSHKCNYNKIHRLYTYQKFSHKENEMMFQRTTAKNLK